MWAVGSARLAAAWISANSVLAQATALVLIEPFSLGPDFLAPQKQGKGQKKNLSGIPNLPGDIDLLVRYNYTPRLHETYWFRKHVRDLPGKPDIVFVKARLVVFLDGNFWHRYRFPQWEKTLAKSWRKKIGETRKRGHRNFAKLRRMGWRVLRI